MEQEKKIEAYSKLLYAVLDYFQEEGIIDHKQLNMVMAYCRQGDESQEKIRYKKIEKILNMMDEKCKKQNIEIPSYHELSDNEGSILNFSGDYSVQREFYDFFKNSIEFTKNRIKKFSLLFCKKSYL